jgi:hypothetical protein
VQRRRAAVDQAPAERGDDVGTEPADAVGIVTVGGHALGQPARDLGAASLGKPPQLGEVRDRHDPGHDRHLDAGSAGLVDKAEIGVGVVEILGDGTVGAGIDLGLEVAQVGERVLRLRMGFRITGHFDVEMVAVR